MNKPKRIRLRGTGDELKTKPLIGGDKTYVGVYNKTAGSGRILELNPLDAVTDRLVLDLGDVSLNDFISKLKNELVKLGVPFEKEIRVRK